jgi:hypothetical protein
VVLICLGAVAVSLLSFFIAIFSHSLPFRA